MYDSIEKVLSVNVENPVLKISTEGNMMNGQKRQLRQLAWSLTAFASFLLLWRLSGNRSFYSSLANQSDIYNSTFGFERVFAISFPDRTDKRDALVLATSYIDVDLEWSRSVAFEDISPKAAPVNWDYGKRSPGSLGCWRAHMDVLQKIVHEKIETALVLEDDSDFDISIKQQLYNFASGARALQGSSSPPYFSPYGDEWDFLWLGHCKLGPGDDQKKLYVMEDDPTVAPPSKRNALWYSDYVPDEVQHNSSRVVFKANNGGLCMYAYAITLEGARTALSTMSIVPRDDVVDMSYRHICAGRYHVPFECYGVYPPVFGSHRAAGPRSRDSDLNVKSHGWHEEYTFDILYSVMQNIERLAMGADTIKAQWPEDVNEPEWLIGRDLPTKGVLKSVDLKALGKSNVKGINRRD